MASSTVATTSGQKFFLPIWNLFMALFTYFLFLELLKKLGLIKEGKSK